MRPLGLITAAVTALTLAGCATRIVSSHVEPGINFGAYHTYDWETADALPVGDPRLDNNEFFRDYLQGAVDKALTARGFALTATDPDLLIHTHASVTHELDVDAIEREYANCPGRSCSPGIIDYERGTLIVDVVDRRSKKLLWRGWSQDNFSGLINNQQRLQQAVVDAVAEIMEQFPRPPL